MDFINIKCRLDTCPSHSKSFGNTCCYSCQEADCIDRCKFINRSPYYCEYMEIESPVVNKKEKPNCSKKDCEKNECQWCLINHLKDE